MPQISFFLGIEIVMHYKDHAPPHFHAQYGDFDVAIEIKSGIVKGRFPSRALHLVLEWAMLHKDELTENWDPDDEKVAFEANRAFGVER